MVARTGQIRPDLLSPEGRPSAEVQRERLLCDPGDDSKECSCHGKREKNKETAKKRKKEVEAKIREQQGRDGHRSEGHENGKCLHPTGKVLVLGENHVCL